MLIKQREHGFTIVELLIVIVVIGILASITTVAYLGVQARARNLDRQSDISAVQKALEIYRIKNNSYPRQGTIDGMDNVNFPVTVLDLPRSAIISPTAPEGTQNSFDENKWAGDTSTDYYGYRAINAADDACWDEDDICVYYEIWYKFEGEAEERIATGDE